MKILHDALTLIQVELFKTYWNTNQKQVQVNWGSENHFYESISKNLDVRLRIDSKSHEWEIIRNLVFQNFDSEKVKGIYCAYQQQDLPHNLHIDDYGKNSEYYRYTYIIALDSIPEFKAIIFKEEDNDNDIFSNRIQDWGRIKKILSKKNELSQTQDIDHTIDQNQLAYLAEYLTLDGVFEYQAGSAVLFKATQIHCSSDWIKYKKFKHRHLLQIHVLSEELLDL
jgi:hypothetical protein